jgi:hypothetical protein
MSTFFTGKHETFHKFYTFEGGKYFLLSICCSLEKLEAETRENSHHRGVGDPEA